MSTTTAHPPGGRKVDRPSYEARREVAPLKRDTAVMSIEIAMGKVWVLDTETKGTGAQMVPLEKVLEEPAPKTEPRRSRRRRSEPARAPRAPESQRRSEKKAPPLPPGHVRKKATGEIGRVQAVDSKAGTARVMWLKQGRSSTVPLTAISRR
jgi:hypothetical protein